MAYAVARGVTRLGVSGDDRRWSLEFAVYLLIMCLLYRYRKHRWRLWLTAALGLAAVVMVVVSASVPDWQPLTALEYPAVEAQVIPGGEYVELSRQLPPRGRQLTALHVAFWVCSPDLALAAGHATKLESGSYQATIYGDGPEQSTAAVERAEVIGDHGFGLVVAGLPRPERLAVPLAAAAELRAGPASVVSFGREHPVELVGFTERDGLPYLVLKADRAGVFYPGVSGSPVLQDGRLIAVHAQSPRFSTRWGLALVAAVAWLGMAEQGYFDPHEAEGR
jgi:hypothetical protein